MVMRKIEKICVLLIGSFFLSTCVFAQAEFSKTTISDIQHNSSEFYGKEVEVQAYFYKTDDLWVKSLDQPDQYIGLFVSKPGKDTLPFLGEYFGFVFVPQQMQSHVRFLKTGDKITIRGKCFEFKSASIDGPGIKVSELLVGWGKEAKPATASLPVTREEVVSLIQDNNTAAVQPFTSSAASSPASLSAQDAGRQKYNLYLNGKEYQGLTAGDEYAFEGIRFRVDKFKEGKE